MAQKVIITGITGLIGKALARALTDAGYTVVGLTRQPESNPDLTEMGVRLIRWNGSCPDSWYHELPDAHAVINLTGENIAAGRWNSTRKEIILSSRIFAIHSVQDALSLVSVKPQLFIQASAIGYYGPIPKGKTDESSLSGHGFLASVCREVESEAFKTEDTRVVIARFGVVLDPEAGALAKITASMKIGICGMPYPAGNMMSWIHPDDLTRSILHLLSRQEHQPVYNFCAPQPVTFSRFIRKAARLKKVYICLPLPWKLLSLRFGKSMVDETLRTDQNVVPAALLSEGFVFKYTDAESALEALLT